MLVFKGKLTMGTITPMENSQKVKKEIKMPNSNTKKAVSGSGMDRKVERKTNHVKRVAMFIAGAIFLYFIYNIFDEATQPMFGRTFETWDIFANCLGIFLGQIAFVIADATGWRKKALDLR